MMSEIVNKYCETKKNWPFEIKIYLAASTNAF